MTPLVEFFSAKTISMALWLSLTFLMSISELMLLLFRLSPKSFLVRNPVMKELLFFSTDVPAYAKGCTL